MAGLIAYVCRIHKGTLLDRGVCEKCGGAPPLYDVGAEGGQTYRHYKEDKLYKILFVSVWSGTPIGGAFQNATIFLPENELLVNYIALYDNPHGNDPCTRLAREWVEIVSHPTSGAKLTRYRVEDNGRSRA